MKYLIIAAIISAVGALILIDSSGSSWIGAALIAVPWFSLPIVSFIERKLKK